MAESICYEQYALLEQNLYYGLPWTNNTVMPAAQEGMSTLDIDKIAKGSTKRQEKEEMQSPGYGITDFVRR